MLLPEAHQLRKSNFLPHASVTAIIRITLSLRHDLINPTWYLPGWARAYSKKPYALAHPAYA